MTPTGSVFALVGLWGMAGLGFGLVYFAMLRRTVELYGTARNRASPALLTAGRLAAAIVFLGTAASFGASPLLAAFFGFLAARGMALHAARGEG